MKEIFFQPSFVPLTKGMIINMKDVLAINKKSNTILNIIMILYSLVCFLPLLLVLMISVTDEKTIAMNGYNFFPEKFSLSSYDFIFGVNNTIFRAYGITILATVIGTLLSIILITLYAYPLSRNDFKYRNHFGFFVFFTMLFNAGMVPWYYMYSSILHLKNTLAILIIPWLISPFLVIVTKTFIKTTISDSIIESAKIDGAGEFRIFFQIVIPLLKPALATIALFQSLVYWNDWYLPLVFITEPKLDNLQSLLHKVEQSINFLSKSSDQISLDTSMADMPTETARMAMAVVVIGPIIFVYPFFQRYFVKGLTIGAVKG